MVSEFISNTVCDHKGWSRKICLSGLVVHVQNKGIAMAKQGNSNMIHSVIYVSFVSSVFFLSQHCLANDDNGVSLAERMDANGRMCRNSYVMGPETNVLESLARNVYIIREKEVNTNKGEGSSTLLGRFGLSDTLQGVLIAGLMSGIGMLFRWVLQNRTEEKQSKAMLKQEERAQKRRIKNERKKAYLDFMAHFLLANNWFRAHNDLTLPEEERQKFENLLPPESVAKAAEINARMRLFASKEIAEAHLKFLEASKVIYSATDKHFEQRATDVGKILIIISGMMNKELSQIE